MGLARTKGQVSNHSGMPKRADGNQKAITAALRKVGASVQCLHTIGKGCPDILVGWHGVNFLFEIKQPGGKLTPDESKFFETWAGQVDIIFSAEEAIQRLDEIQKIGYKNEPS